MIAHPLEGILGPIAPFMDCIVRFTEEQGLPIRCNEIDHLCFRCDSKEQYKYICTEIVTLKIGSILLESMIGGRPISIVLLAEPINYEHWQIACLELTCPKPGRSHKHGFEHIEVVISQDGQSFSNSEAYLLAFAAHFPRVDFDLKAAKKPINADVSVSAPDGSSVKFHARSIRAVCEYEIAQGHFVSVPEEYFHL